MARSFLPRGRDGQLMLIDGVIALLQSTESVSSLATGIYESELPRGFALPAVAVHQYGGSEDTDLAGPIGLLEAQIQFDCYAITGPSARAVAAAIEALLKPFTGSLPDGTVLSYCKLQRSMAMPFRPHADQKGIANWYTTGFSVVISTTPTEV